MAAKFRNAELRAAQFATTTGTQLIGQLGAGYDGVVFETDRDSAIKAFEFERLYCRERDIYCRLAEHNLYDVEDCRIPRMLAYDDTLFVIEMGIVQPPFVLDFAGA